MDEHGVVIEANAAAAALLGHAKLRLEGKPLPALIALADRRRFRRALLKLEPGRTEVLELRLLREDRPCTATLRVLPLVARRRVAVTLAHDLPIVVADEPAAPDPAKQLELLALRYPYAVVGLHGDMSVAFWNGHARALLGPEAVRSGQPFKAPPLLLALARRLVELPAALAPTEVDLDGGLVVRVSGLALDARSPAVLFVEDVSGRHRHERVMREFLRNAAHQLRTPLTGITAAVELLQAGAKEVPEDRDRFLAHVAVHADRLSRLARGLLLLARAETGEAAPLDLVELAPLIDDVVAHVQPRDDVALEYDCPTGLTALATPSLLYEVLAALLDNAIAHTHEGRVRVTAGAVDGRVSVTVSDTGPGILPEFVDRVFEPFFQVAPSGDGYGLGLAIAAQAVKAMGGDIDVSSAVGAGTSFTVRLPTR